MSQSFSLKITQNENNNKEVQNFVTSIHSIPFKHFINVDV